MAVIVFILIIISPTILLTVLFNKKYERMIPVTCALISLILFFSGLLKLLTAGVITILVMAIGCLSWSVFELIKKGKVKAFFTNLFSEGFIAFLILSIVAVRSVSGKLFDSWDEFSHWGDIVKAMSFLDDFGTNSLSFSLFKNYPPGMSLLQYFLEKLFMFFPKGHFEEWLTYFVYQVYCFSFLIPLFCLKTQKGAGSRIVSGLLSAAVVFFAPLTFAGDIWRYLYIDPFLGVVFGAGAAGVCLEKNKKDFEYHMFIWASCFSLALGKDSGLLFGVFLFLFYIVDYLISDCKESKIDIRSLLLPLCVAIFSFLPKALWNAHITGAGVKPETVGKIDLHDCVNVILHRTTNYRSTVCASFKYHFFSERRMLGDTVISLSYFVIAVLIFALTAAVLFVLKKRKIIAAGSGQVTFLGLGITWIIYIAGIVVSYMYCFSEYEALALASFERYMSVIYLALWIFFLATLFKGISESESIVLRYVAGTIFLVAVIFCSDKNRACNYLSRKNVAESIELRSGYDNLVSMIQTNCTSDDKLFLISEEDNGFDLIVLNETLRPLRFFNHDYSIGEPQYQGDEWTIPVSADELKREIADGYSFVAVKKINDYFRNEYSSLFATGENICGDTLYKVCDDGLLRACH